MVNSILFKVIPGLISFSSGYLTTKVFLTCNVDELLTITDNLKYELI
jgi:hypothetical protein